MTTRRKELGLRIKSARRADGYKSAKAFGRATGISETSIARAESGDSRVGQGVYMDIEAALGWPDSCIFRYLETGDPSSLPSRTGMKGDDEWAPRDDMERKIMASSLPRAEKIDLVRGYRDALAEERMLFPDQDHHPHSPTLQQSGDKALKPPGQGR